MILIFLARLAYVTCSAFDVNILQAKLSQLIEKIIAEENPIWQYYCIYLAFYFILEILPSILLLLTYFLLSAQSSSTKNASKLLSSKTHVIERTSGKFSRAERGNDGKSEKRRKEWLEKEKRKREDKRMYNAFKRNSYAETEEETRRRMGYGLESGMGQALIEHIDASEEGGDAGLRYSQPRKQEYDAGFIERFDGISGGEEDLLYPTSYYYTPKSVQQEQKLQCDHSLSAQYPSSSSLSSAGFSLSSQVASESHPAQKAASSTSSFQPLSPSPSSSLERDLPALSLSSQTQSATSATDPILVNYSSSSGSSGQHTSASRIKSSGYPYSYVNSQSSYPANSTTMYHANAHSSSSSIISGASFSSTYTSATQPPSAPNLWVGWTNEEREGRGNGREREEFRLHEERGENEKEQNDLKDGAKAKTKEKRSKNEHHHHHHHHRNKSKRDNSQILDIVGINS
ncbi:uncharacterized protein MONOS_9818 [Monocercomonoides exilis]|uniref:uncharacterized protein n=1 Tax=Monocercomonoides exilis TaxID=2049356 RepID=UPI003559A381|nr:hypothetical protein MONOS_9818 [Monocercomonoides exilis]|eukprot:MONOS_9818.1-p1 / transcript=MONOS_9818.1 / gene=MONOS_9818 / organism=Monocercomonoides_exilis_PA203 / gene_product=unspecified product / transcript_product=unspecified product / location=Mono_scaffold00419:49714-51161(+) / protein_length=458 / sequence_SO=supercontig / SO=protein_coding / is_pseudo=false